MGSSTLTGTRFGSISGDNSLEWVGSYEYTQNQKANTTTLTLYGSLYVPDGGGTIRSNNSYDTLKVNGVTISPPTPSAYRYSSSQTYGYSVTAGYSLFGSTTKTVTHNANGTFPTTAIELWADSYQFRHNGSATSGSFNISGIPTIDRNAPTLTISLSSYTTSSLTVAVTASANCDRWEYSINNGSTYTQYSTTSGTSSTATISGLSANTTYNVRIRARRTVNEVYGTSSTGSYTTQDASAPSVTISLSSRTSSSLTINATADTTCNKWEYSTNNGSSYTQFSTTSATSVSYTITGLSPNTTYNVKVRATKKSNSVTGVSATGAYTTLGAALINSATEIYADAATVQVKINGTFYSSSYTYSLLIKRGSTTLVTLSVAAQSAGTKDVTVTLTSAQRTSLLSGMSDVASFSATYSLLTYNNSTQIGSASNTTAVIKTSSGTSRPDIPTFNYADINTSTVSVTNNSSKLVQGRSVLRLTNVASTAHNGASIASYTVTIADVTKTSTSGGTINVGAVSQSGNLTLKVTAKDTRGYSRSSSVTVECYAYSLPTITSYIVRRNANTSTQIDANASGTFSNIGTNTVTLKYKYKKSTDSSYGAEVTATGVTTSGGTFSFTKMDLATFDDDSTYNFVYTVSDKIGSAVYNILVPTFTPLIAYRPSSIGLGTVPQGNKRLELAQDWGVVAPGKNHIMGFMPYSWTANVNDGTTGYMRIATIVITRPYMNQTIDLQVIRRYDVTPVHLYVGYTVENSSDPALAYFNYYAPGGLYNNRCRAYIIKTTTSTWDVYIEKNGGTDYATVSLITGTFAQDRCNITYTSNFQSSIPSGATSATSL